MSGRLHLKLLGGFRASFDSGQACHLPTRKSQALLAYLALPSGRFHPRDRLAALLWGETAEAQARQSLRQALGSVRRTLRDEAPSAMLTHEDTVALNPEAVTVDVLDFEAALADRRTEALERAVLLYEGDFLAGFRVDEPSFEEWRVVERERLHELALEGLARLLREHVRTARDEAAIQTALRILAMDPVQESVHRALMRLLLGQGRRAAALSQYQTCVSHLQRELGAEPEEDTRQLYREILRTTGSRSASAGTPAAAASIMGARPVEIPLIGRESEVERLRDAQRRMVDDGGHVVLVTGEAGMGKTRLITELVTSATASGAAISLGGCHETEQTLPLRPWIEALRSGAADASIRDRLSATARAQLAPLFPELRRPGDAAGASAAPAPLFDPLLELISTLASDQPRVIIVEDLHWADATSARFFAFLGRRIERLPVLVVGSMRPEELVDAPALAQALRELRAEGRLSEIALGPLSDAETRTLVRALRPSPRVDPDTDRVVEEIWGVSGGNPFVVVESIRSLRQHAGEPAADGLRVGRRVQDVVAARLDRLGELPRQCVAVAATIGRDFPFALLSRAASVDDRDAADAVEELVRRRIFDSVGDRLDFCHDWIRVVAYDALLPAKRALFHAVVAAALEDIHRERLDEIADQLGSHYWKAGNFRKAIPHLIRFGDLAAQRYALEDGYRALSQAMAGADHLPPSERDRCRLDVALRQAFVLSILGRQREILEVLRQHADRVEQVADAPLRSEYYFRLGLTHLFLGDHAQAEAAAKRALEEAERIGDPERIGKALHVLSLHAYNMGRPDTGIALAKRGISLLDLPHTQVWLGLVYQDLALNYVVAGALDAALDTTARMEAIGKSAPLPRLLAFAGFVAAWALGLRGDAELAVEAARRALQIARDPMVAGLVTGVLSHAYLEQGDAGSAVSELTRALDQLKDSPTRHAEIRNMALLGEAHLLAGDTARAREAAARALELGLADGMPLNIGLAQRALGRIARAAGDHDEAERYLAQSLATFSSSGAVFEAGRTRVDIAGVQSTRGDKDGAREHLVAALAIFEEANTPKRAAAVRDLARSLTITLP